MAEKIKFAFICIILCIIPLIAAIFIDFDYKQESIKKYNNGYCKECGIKYKTYYAWDEGQKYIVYECPHCYKMGNINVYLVK